MAIGEVRPVETGAVSDTYYLDTGMYDVAGYGAVYLVDAERPVLVDSGIGTNYERILGAMETVGIAPEDLQVVALTHVHLDHAGGAGFLCDACPNADVYVHEVGAPHVVDPERLWEGTKRAVGGQIEYYVEPEPVPAERVVELEDGDAIDLGDRTFDVHHVPGHAPHQVVFHDAEESAVYTADAAGIHDRSRGDLHVTSPPPNFDLEVALDDVETIAGLEPDTLLYPHFGPALTGEKLGDYAELLEDWVADVEATYEELGDEDAVVEHFVAESDAGEVWGAEKARYEVSLNVRGVLHYLAG